MKKQNLILSAALAAIFSASTAFAEAEVTGKIIHESGFFSNAGSTIGADTLTLQGVGNAASYQDKINAHKKNDAMKSETSARIYVDGEIDKLAEGATYHVELNLMTDGEGVGKYDSHESYTQRDALREAYVDSQVGDWSLRSGKQQVVWGTADGMKLLDAINPTDYSEMAQNQMEDSRIPVWMVNAETTNEDGSEFQVVISEPRENIFAGLNRHISTAARINTSMSGDGATAINTFMGRDTAPTSVDSGSTFIMKGVDTITGKSNGFLNIVPDLGSVSSLFGRAFATSGSSNNAGLSILSHTGNAMDGFTVGGFNSAATLGALSGSFAAMTGANGGLAGGVTETFATVNFGGTGFWAASTTYTGQQALAGFGGMFATNLHNTTAGADSAFEYMDRTSFSTFDAFVGAKSKYKYSMPSGSDADVSVRYKNSTPSGVNYSLNYSNGYDKNPIIDLSWVNDAGEKLITTKHDNLGGQAGDNSMRLSLSDSAGNGYGGYAADLANGATINGSVDSSRFATLQFEQKVKRIQNIGGSFDMAIETKTLGPVVIRGEGLYQKDVYSPVMDRGALSIGDLPAALTMRKGDRFKYVLGADVTALTNMMVSVQFIQDKNLDYIDSNIDHDGDSCSGTTSTNCGVYSADYSTMSMSNGFNKATKDKNFYSLFLSKPFGASGEHRWNNIIMLEDTSTSGGTGKWNRFDAEFSIDDDTQATVEYNKYWGNANTQFGQLEKSSNIQVGVKYSF